MQISGADKEADVVAHRLARRIPELDGLRGIAVLMVLAYHLFSYTMRVRPWTGVPQLVSYATKTGWEGVDLFFVLSGFLITGILLDSHNDPNYFRNFYARRALRILPLYYFIVLIIWLFYPHSGRYALLSALFLSNIAPLVGVLMINGAMWSLSVEEHFYLVWPLVVHRLQMRSVAAVALAICVIEPVVRALSFTHVQSVYVYTWFRLDGLACGALMACVVRSSLYQPRHIKRLCMMMAIGGLLLMAVGAPFGILTNDNQFGAALQFVPTNLLFSAAVLFGATASGSQATAILRIPMLRVTAELSYCLYLTHLLVMAAYDNSLQALHLSPAISSFEGILIRALAVIAASFGLATLSHIYLEAPALRLKRSFAPAGASSKPKAV